MNTLRVLVVNNDPEKAERLAGILEGANYMALPASGLEEASEALFVQKFDAVLLGPPLPSDGVAEFTAKLRQLENSQRAAARTPVLSLSADMPEGAAWFASGAEAASATKIDGYVSEACCPAALLEAVTTLAASTSSDGAAAKGGAVAMAVLDAERFREQVGFDPDLLIEIIDLFLAEGPQQVIEMREALAEQDFERVSRVAHTIKGSFGTLHAGLARHHAQELESAARERDTARCRQGLSALEYDLELLEPQLLSLRNAPGAA
jgi:HPt (histidine-containing phosphotransfer) domain-containing protein/CheY-like chemotaxis protein